MSGSTAVTTIGSPRAMSSSATALQVSCSTWTTPFPVAFIEASERPILPTSVSPAKYRWVMIWVVVAWNANVRPTAINTITTPEAM